MAAPALAAQGDLTTVAGGPGGGLATGLGLVPSGLSVDGGDLVTDQGGPLRRPGHGRGDGPGRHGRRWIEYGLRHDGPARDAHADPGVAAGVAGPPAVALALDGDVVFSVGGGGSVRRLDRTTGTLIRIAGTT